MTRSIGSLAGILASSLMLALAQPALAQDKAEVKKEAKGEAKAEKGKAQIKELINNDKVRVVEATFKPGDEGTNVARPFRVVRPLKGGTLTFIYPDGRKEKVTFKTGEVSAVEATPPYIPKNEGKSDIVLYIVFVKEPKK